MSVYKYLDLVSSSRVRSLYPNPADYVAPVSYGAGTATSAFSSQDPVSAGIPSVISTTQAGSTTTSIVLNSSSSTIQNFYNDNYLQIGTEVSLITAYNGTTMTATIATPITAPGAGTTYYIRGALPVYSGTLGAGSTQNLLNLGVGASSTDQAYYGYYIYFTTGVDAGTSMLITAYTGATMKARLSKALASTPSAGDAYDIVAWTADSSCPLIYSGTIGFNQAVCYSIELLYLTIPNQVLSSGYGGTLNNYPFLLLYMYNEGNAHSDHTMYTNNPAAQSTMFKIPLGLNLKSETFFTLKDAKMIQISKFKPDQPVRFRLVLPDGSPIVFATPDNQSPLAVNPLLQISATFALRRIEGENPGKK